MREDVQPGAVTPSESQGKRARDKMIFLVAEQLLISPSIIYLKIKRIINILTLPREFFLDDTICTHMTL